MEPATITRIDLPLSELTDRRNVVTKECYLLLHPAHLEYKIVSTYDSNDNDEGVWKEYKANYRWTKLKSSISDVGMYYDNPEGTWVVSLGFTGVSGTCGWHFQNPKDALKVYNQLAQYHIGT